MVVGGTGLVQTSAVTERHAYQPVRLWVFACFGVVFN